jgi:rhomboid protease GluP
VTQDDAAGPDGWRALLRRPDPVTLTVLLLCAAVEATLQLADAGLLGSERLRFLAYSYGGFWPGLLDDWRPNYPGQPVAMFLTYSILHGGLVHFAVNMVTLLSLGAGVSERAGPARHAAVYVAAILGGAAVFALLAPGPRPMVGASGALFGLVGALVVWETLDRRALRLLPAPDPQGRGLPRGDEPRSVVGHGRAAGLADPSRRFPRRRVAAMILGQRPLDPDPGRLNLTFTPPPVDRDPGEK